MDEDMDAILLYHIAELADLAARLCDVEKRKGAEVKPRAE